MIIMKLFNSRVLYALDIYLLVVILIMVSKPALFFNKDDSVRPFGTGAGENRTVFSLGIAVAIIAIASYYLVTVIDCVLS